MADLEVGKCDPFCIDIVYLVDIYTKTIKGNIQDALGKTVPKIHTAV